MSLIEIPFLQGDEKFTLDIMSISLHPEAANYIFICGPILNDKKRNFRLIWLWV